MADKEFVPGLYVKKPLTKDGNQLPEFIIAKGSIKIVDLMQWLHTRDGDWVNFTVMQPKDPDKNWYVEVDNWEPKKDDSAAGTPDSNAGFKPMSPTNIDDDDLPF